MRLQNPATKIGGSDIGVRLTLRITGPEVSAFLESSDLTGPLVTPMSGVLSDSDLIFVNKESGASIRLPVIRSILGGSGAFTSPWQTAGIPLEAGDYVVNFRGRVSALSIGLIKLVDVTIQLDDKSSHGTTSSIFTSGSFLASSPAYRFAMSKKPIWPIAGSPDPRVTSPRF